MQRAIGRRPWPSAPSLLLVATLVVGALVVLPTTSTAQERSSDDIQRELDGVGNEAGAARRDLSGVRSRIAAEEEELAAIGARLEDARGRLVAAEGRVALAEVALEEAEQEQLAAEASHAEAIELLRETEEELAYQEGLLVDHLVQTFKYGSSGAAHGAAAIEVLRRADDPNAFAVGIKQLQTVVDVQESTVQSVVELRVLRLAQEEEAALARAAAVQAAADAASTLRSLEELRAQAATVASEVAQEEAAQTALLGRLRTTEQQTAELLRRVEARQAELSRDLRAQRQREEAARVAALAASGGGGGAAGGPGLTGMVCPVKGASSRWDFSNDWGDPRSGGRAHQGNDIFAARGTAVVAVHDGVVVSMNPASAPTSLGGITVTYRTGDGSEWYNAHLNSIAAGIAPGVAVSRGQTVGTVGNTGNARTTPPHLHLGRRYAGSWVNPWPTIAPVC